MIASAVTVSRSAHVAPGSGRDRRSLPADTLRTLYLQYGLTADEVGREVDASRKIVLRSAHDLGLPVRAAVAVPSAAPAEIMLTASCTPMSSYRQRWSGTTSSRSQRVPRSGSDSLNQCR